MFIGAKDVSDIDKIHQHIIVLLNDLKVRNWTATAVGKCKLVLEKKTEINYAPTKSSSPTAKSKTRDSSNVSNNQNDLRTNKNTRPLRPTSGPPLTEDS